MYFQWILQMINLVNLKYFFFIDFCHASDLIFREKFEILLEISEGLYLSSTEHNFY